MSNPKTGYELLLTFIEEDKKNREMLAQSDSDGDRLYYELIYNNPETEKEWRTLQHKVHEFLNGNAPKIEKDKLQQYTEMLAMVVSGYDYMKQEESE